MNIFPGVVNVNINYKKGAVVGDVLKIETVVKKISKRSISMSQKVCLKDTGDVVSKAEIINVLINRKNGELIPVDGKIIDLWSDLFESIDGTDITFNS